MTDQSTEEQAAEESERLKRLRAQTGELYQAIGRFVVEFEFMIFCLRQCIIFALQREGLGEQEYARIMVADLNNRALVHKLEAVVEQTYGTESKNEVHARRVFQIVKSIIEERNRIIHSTWFIGFASSEDNDFSKAGRIRERALGSLRFQSEDLTVADFDELTERIRSAKDNLMALNACMLLGQALSERFDFPDGD